MRIFLVVGETPFYQPDFIADFLRKTPDEVIGAALVTKVGPKGNIERYLIRHLYLLRPRELVRLCIETIKALTLNIFSSNKNGSFYSIRKVLKTFDIPHFEVKRSINKPEYLERIKALKPDVIVSSNPLIFKDEILKIPTKGCLNRHSALLPSYGGLWPVFQALRMGEKYTGVTIHTMEREIDKGIILSQVEIPTDDKSVAELYALTFQESAQALLDALDKVRSGTLVSIEPEYTPSYFSFPTHQHWKEFRAKKKVFI